MFIAIYITFVIINLIICSAVVYFDYKSYQKITVSDIVMCLGVSALSWGTTIAFLIISWDHFSDKILIQRKRKC